MQTHLQDSTLTKILREHFQGETPITIPSEPERREFLAELKNQLSTRPGFTTSDAYWFTGPEKALVHCFKVISSLPHYYNQEFCVKFNEQHELVIATGWQNSTKVYRLEQIYTLVEKMSMEYERINKSRVKRENEVIKREKIKGLKHTAILASIHEIAKEDKFEFRICEYKTKVKLIIRLTKVEQVEIDIPYHRFQDILKMLRGTIQQIRTYYELGLTFKVRSYLNERNPQWIRYD